MPPIADPSRLLVILPTWLGDIVMATPTLRALRARFLHAHLATLCGSALAPLLDGCPWVDEVVTFPRLASGRKQSLFRMASKLRAMRFDAVVLLPNSFRWALAARLAGIPRRIGYARDARGALLTDRLLAPRNNAGFAPMPTLDYYLAIAAYLGADTHNKRPALFTRPDDDERAVALLHDTGCHPTDAQPLVLLNPGASYVAKRWPADRFAQLADRLASRLGAHVALTGSPDERSVLDAVHAAAATPLLDLPKLGFDLRLAKSAFRMASLVVTNDTGPRHIAAAFNTPVVTIFGPTTPDWTTLDFPLERQVVSPNSEGARNVNRHRTPASLLAISIDTVEKAALEAIRLPATAAPPKVKP